MKVLFNRGVAYLNMDYAVDYTYKLDVYTSPLLEDAMYKAAKQVRDDKIQKYWLFFPKSISVGNYFECNKLENLTKSDNE